ncbi:helix-turn-helix domain-containing protein [Halorubellus sp. PRR65]|uniref:TrmB family transcriptional regulator n=1 Tax=Halorubellus sp. PRR65 TaxID=3098148 RepID=UPI002B25D784|nr:helix-turn-helix domain-containing protein [Halorubellus sp. PRR65]
MDERDAVAALEHLGLTSYEARVFIALQKLETGTARDISRIADVPRSQVYGAAEGLEDHGLVEVQQSSPIRYRPVDLDVAKTHLRSRFEAHQSDAFRYLERVERDRASAGDQQEDIWTVQGSGQIESRVRDLASNAEATLLYACSAEELTCEFREMLNDRARAGVDVTYVSADADLDAFDAGVRTVRFPDRLQPPREQSGRALTVDSHGLLLSVLGSERVPGASAETAIWSDETAFAAVLSELLQSWFTTHLDVEAAGRVTE